MMQNFDPSKNPPLLLSNFEVLNTLKEVKKNTKIKDQGHLATVTYEAINYLEELPCAVQNESAIKNFLSAIKEKGIRLTKAEKLQIINCRPNNLVEMQLLIEENEERFSEEGMNFILDLIDEHLPSLESSKSEEMATEVNDDDEDTA